MSHYIYIVILDFEASCWNGSINKEKMEIIEFPSVLVKWNVVKNTTKRIGEFQRYCKPKSKEKLTKFCTDLTGITQKMVDHGCTFREALAAHDKWLRKCIPKYDMRSDVYIMTVGHWDINIQFPRDVRRWGISKKGIHKVYKKYVNIKEAFISYLSKKNMLKTKKGYGMKGMLDFLTLELEGRHHSGIDDCKNTTKILEALIEMGMTPEDMVVHKSNFFKK